jgi:glutathione reductase (NADPH)
MVFLNTGISKSTYDFDLFVTGGGSGGVRASRTAAGHGAKVAVTEEYRVGDTCVIRGCVPRKLMMYASRFGVARLEKVYETLLEKAGVEVLSGRATIVGPHEVCLNDVRITADRILIATGSTPEMPEFPGGELMLTSDDVFRMTRAPQRVAIVGGGYIACEFASIFIGLGSKVWLVHRGSRRPRNYRTRLGCSRVSYKHPRQALAQPVLYVWNLVPCGHLSAI